ncbi:hypothetical protein GCM10010428_42720 [Actinosynnema pretiosum subsp. pretiosum]
MVARKRVPHADGSWVDGWGGGQAESGGGRGGRARVAGERALGASVPGLRAARGGGEGPPVAAPRLVRSPARRRRGLPSVRAGRVRPASFAHRRPAWLRARLPRFSQAALFAWPPSGGRPGTRVGCALWEKRADDRAGML